MDKFIEIHWSSSSLEEARTISHYLVQKGYVACAQIIPCVESVYIWNNQVQTSQESKVLFKTDMRHFEIIKEFIRQNCSYQVPEITIFSISGGDQEYLNWMKRSLS